ncbi:hypothetical protein LCGC14_2698770 [marine sediment metagenome]|uniref:Uncharacterized protein n=1 Tax=marine sediment metagenome TaxID=412755 RepID=A0A0F8ZGD1_9ZZZZ
MINVEEPWQLDVYHGELSFDDGRFILAAHGAGQEIGVDMKNKEDHAGRFSRFRSMEKQLRYVIVKSNRSLQRRATA